MHAWQLAYHSLVFSGSPSLSLPHIKVLDFGKQFNSSYSGHEFHIRAISY